MTEKSNKTGKGETFPILEKDEIEKHLQNLKDWEWADKRLQKTYSFENNDQVIQFLDQIDRIAREEKRSPKIHLEKNSCTVQYPALQPDGWTHQDFICPARLDEPTSNAPLQEPVKEDLLLRRIFGLALFLSGFCGISYEVLYSRILANVMGNHFFVNATILLMFLVGIGLGNKFAHLLSGYLWAVEMGIGVYAIFFTLLIPKLDILFYQIISLGMMAQLALCCLLLFIPTILIGFSLPLFAGSLKALSSKRVFSSVYMIYNFGAAFTVLATEFYLIRHLGLRGTVWLISALNFFIGISLFYCRKKILPHFEKEKSITYIPKVLFSLALVSVASAIFQLYMLKMAAFLLGPYQETFAMVLGIVLFGIAVGAVINHLFKISFSTFLWINIIYLTLLFILFEPFLFLYASYIGGWEGIWIVLWKTSLLFWIMGVSAICFGAAIPALIQMEEDIARESGHLLFVSCMANGAGYLLMALFIHETFTYGQILFLLILLLSLALLIYAWNRRPLWMPLGAACTMALILLTQSWNENLLYLSYTNFSSVQKLKKSIVSSQSLQAFRKYDEVFSINEIEGQKYFFINGYISFPLGTPSEYLVGIFSSLVAPQTKDALVLGLASGASAGAMGEIFDSVEVVEINPAIVDQQPMMKEYNFDIAHKKNVHIEVDDGIRYVKRTEKKYDLIVNTVNTPLYFSSSKLYTQDFFQDVVSRLKDGGVYSTWIDERIGERGLAIILSTLKTKFKYCWLAAITYGYSLLLCSNTPLGLHQENKIFGNEKLKEFFDSRGRILSLCRYAILSYNAYGALAPLEEAPLNTLDRPSLEFEMAKIANKKLVPTLPLYRYLLYNYDLKRMNEEIFKSNPIDLLKLCGYYLQEKENFYYNFFTTKAQRYLSPEKYKEFTRILKIVQITYNERIFQQYPHLQRALDLIQTYFFFGEYKKALDFLQKELPKYPRHKELHRMLISLYFSIGQFHKAIEASEKALELHPQDGLIMSALAKCYIELRMYKRAIPWLEKSLMAHPELENSNALLGVCYLQLGESVMASSYFRRELEINPNNQMAEQYLYTGHRWPAGKR